MKLNCSQNLLSIIVVVSAKFFQHSRVMLFDEPSHCKIVPVNIFEYSSQLFNALSFGFLIFCSASQRNPLELIRAGVLGRNNSDILCNWISISLGDVSLINKLSIDRSSNFLTISGGRSYIMRVHIISDVGHFYSICEIKYIKFIRYFLLTLPNIIYSNNQSPPISQFIFQYLNMIKVILQQTNTLLARYNQSKTPSLWMFLHKWNYENTFTKNFLQFSNRVLRGVNKYHIFRWDWMVGILGGFFGLVVIELQEIYYQIKIGYKPTTSNLIVKGVLKNEAVSNKLKQALNSNVFTNQDIQYFVHQALLNQVLHPQKQTIKKLISSSIHSINNEQTLMFVSTQLAQNVNIIKQPIKGAALGFLGSPQMDKIAAKGLKSVLEALFLKQIIANQINETIKSSLRDTKNSMNLYQMIKQKISF